MENTLWRLKKKLFQYMLNSENKNLLSACSAVHEDITFSLSRKRVPRCLLYAATLCMLCVTLWMMTASVDPSITIGVFSNGDVVDAVYKCAVDNKDGTVDVVFNIPYKGRNSSLHHYLHLNTSSIAKRRKQDQNVTAGLKHVVRSKYPLTLDGDYLINTPYICQVGRPLDYLIIVHRAEMIAVLKAMEIIYDNPPHKLTILTDSLSTVMALKNNKMCNRPDIAEEIFFASTYQYTRGSSLLIMWIRAHVGIRGNEMADSATTYFVRRRAIRETYGSQKLFGNILQRVVFLLGTTKDPATSRSIQEEAFLHRDIVQGQFIDSYHNLTHKGILGLRWVTEYCPQAKIIIKIDDDVFINPFKLVQDVLPKFRNKTRLFACHLRKSGTSSIGRGKGKWVVHDDEFKGLRYYPFEYCNGYFVIITPDIILPMLKAARLNPFFWIDDVYLFGILPATIGSTKFVDIKASLALRYDVGNKCYQENGAKCKYLAVSQWRQLEPEKFWYLVLSNLTMAVKRELHVFGLS